MCWQQSREKEKGQNLIFVGFWLWFPGSNYGLSEGGKHEQPVVLEKQFKFKDI